MSGFQIRTATADDLETIVEFNRRLADETEGKRLDTVVLRAGVAAVLDDRNKGRYLLSCDAGQVIGQLMHTREWSDWRNGDFWWLQSVYVLDEYRRRGVFRRLYCRALDDARAEPSVVGLRLYVERGNDSARATYRQLGMDDAGYQVMEQLTP